MWLFFWLNLSKIFFIKNLKIT
ncbi:hypothetical protein CT19431_MP30302 [Cupriavidus taiwanensis]|nr:hypothetical protein CT19431_MP30302 [Cupriavidus taiwanensis]